MKKILFVAVLSLICITYSLCEEAEHLLNKNEARGWGWGAPAHYGNEIFSGPGVILFAPIIALVFISILWFSAFSTVRDAGPAIGYSVNAGGSGWGANNAGWGWNQAGSTGAAGGSGWGWNSAASVQHATVVSPGGPSASVAASAPVPVAVPAPSSVAAVTGTGRSFDDLTKSVISSIEKLEKQQGQ